MASPSGKVKRRKSVDNPSEKIKRRKAKPSSPKRKSSSAASRSAFPSAQGAEGAMLRKKLNEYEQQIKSLTRDNKVLARKIEKLDDKNKGKNKVIDKEKDMRLNANKDRYWLKQKLDRLQKAIEARLKMLGIDFSNINDLSEALEAAFNAIQKLAAELAKKDEELAALSSKFERAKQQTDDAVKEADKLKRKMAKSKNANDDLKKQMDDKNRRLSAVAKEASAGSDKEKSLQEALDKLRKELDALRKAKNKQFDGFVDKKAEQDSLLRAKEKETAELAEELAAANAANAKMQATNRTLLDELDALRNQSDKQLEKLMEEREKNKQLSEELAECKDELDAANARNDKLKAANSELTDELEKLKALLAEREKELAAANDAIAAHLQRIAQLESDLAAKIKEIASLTEQNSALSDELASTKDLLAQREQELAAQKLANADLAKQSAEDEEALQTLLSEQREMNALLKKKMASVEEKLKAKEADLAERDSELSASQSALENERNAKSALTEQSDAATKDSDEAMEALNAEKAALREMLEKLKASEEGKDAEIARLTQALRDAEQKLNDYMNRPTDEKETQTELGGKWITNAKMQLNNMDNIFKENSELRALASKNDERLLQLADENQVLLDEIDVLLKQQAQFRPDTSNHRGEVLALCAAPNKYTAATSATDKSVRLWTIDPSEAKSKDQVRASFRAQMEGVALSLAYTRDGAYLAAGCAYKNGPDGLIIVWDMNAGDGEVAFLFRSRPSVRFGRAHCVRWSDNNAYIFSGDTTGSIWIWDVAQQIQLAEVRAHKDVLHDIGVAGNALFSCALDQTLSVFDMKKLEARMAKDKKKKKKKSKVHVHEPYLFKSAQIEKDESYPYWVCAPTEDAKTLVAGTTRKIKCFSFSGFGDGGDDKKEKDGGASLAKGAMITDGETDHVQSIQVRRGQVVISRRNVAKANIFSTSNGKLVAKAKFKAPVKRVQFTFDTENCVVCTQKQDGKKVKPPGMHLWNYKK